MTSNKPYRLLIVAPSGVHLNSFIKLVAPATEAIHVITDKVGVSTYPETVMNFSYRKVQNFVQTPKRIQATIESFKPDIVHSHQLNSVSLFAVQAANRSGIPIVATAWGSDVLVNSRKGVVLKAVLQKILKNATAFTADSQEVANRMREIADKDLLISICNFGAEKPEFTRPKENIIYSNRLHNPLYRIDKIIRAFNQFRKSPEGKDWRLIVAGSGSETEKLEALAKDLQLGESIEFQGWVEKEQNAENYAKSKVWVSVPESDATPISLLEAMYHGCFPVVYNLPSLKEWIENDVNGKLVDDVNSNFFDQGLNEIDQNIIERNRQLIDKKGSKESARACFSKLHRRVISDSE